MSTSPQPARPPINWHEVRARVDGAAAALSGPAHGDESRAREILERRARLMARPIAEPAAAADTLPVVAFELAGQTFGIEAGQVRATVFPREITPLPGLPPFVAGLVNLRSQVLAVFDVRPLLRLPPGPPADSPALLIAVFEGVEFGLLVDRVLGARDLPAEVGRRDVAGLNGKYVRGWGEDGLIMLDVPVLYADLVIDDAPAREPEGPPA